MRQYVRHLVETVLVAAIFGGMLALAACPTPPNPQPDGPPKIRDMTAPTTLYPLCSIVDGGALPKTADLCNGLTTPDHRICAHCPGNMIGCLDTVDFVYCIATTSCTKSDGSSADPLCTPETGPKAKRR